LQRFADAGKTCLTNAAAPNRDMEVFAEPDGRGAQLLKDAAESMRFSARAYHRILKVARTIADLDGASLVGRIHIAEAIAYRMAGSSLKQAA
jgi:magnesium chelatase family protein